MKRWERITRITALSLIMLFSITAVLPLISSSAHSSSNPAAASSKKKKLRRYSRAWWRRHRERQRRRRAALLRKKSLAGLRQGRASERQSLPDNSAASNPLLAPLSNMIGLGNGSLSQSTPVIATEHGSRPVPSGVEKGVRLNTPDGQTVGQVSVAVVANAVNDGAASTSARRRALSGVPFAALRRMVIDKMLASGGWVVNDFEREIGGRRVYVVLAQTSAPNDRRVPQQSWTFYFTEAEGRIYNIVSNAPLEFSDRLALEAERVIAMLGPSGTQQSNPSASRR
jgi:hypothetical protein